MHSCTILIVCYYGDEWMPECVNSLQSASLQKLHLLVANNFGNEKLAHINYDHFTSEIIPLNGPHGFAEANNYTLALAKSLSEYIIFLNQDTLSTPGWIDSCLATLENHPELAAISPLIRNYDNTDWDESFLHCLTEKQQWDLNHGTLANLTLVEHVPAAALVVKKSAILEVGPFDPIYGSYYEDYDLCARIRKAGYEVGFCSNAYICHYSGSATTTPRTRLKRERQIIRNRNIYEIRHRSSSRFLQTLKCFVVDFPLRLLRAIFNTRSSQSASAVIRAYIDLFALRVRLISPRRDSKAFRSYLKHLSALNDNSINWLTIDDEF